MIDQRLVRASAFVAILVCPWPANACELEPGISRVVARLERADTLILDDGSEAVLSGVLPPVAGLAVDVDTVSWPPTEASRLALEALVGGKTVEIATAGRRFDRYGRQLVHAFVQGNAGPVWVQGHLVEHGFARAYALPGNLACFNELLAHEHHARSQGRGHWATGIFQDRDATQTAALFGYRDTFQTLTGRVETVRKIRGQYVLSFGGDRNSFEAVMIAARTRKPDGMRLRESDAPMYAYHDLTGKRVRVRGWIEVHRRPQIRIMDAAMIEVLERDDTPAPGDDTQETVGPKPIPAADPN